MKRAQGITAAALVLGGALGRPLVSSDPQLRLPITSAAMTAPMQTSMEAKTREGPKTASCNYWRPGKPKVEDAPKDGDDLMVITKSDEAGKSDWKVKTPDAKIEDGCGENGWGDKKQISGKITALIALVPDPIHSSLSLEFDRTMDVLLQAAAANKYVSSYFWLPWRHVDAAKGSQQGHGEETKEDAAREKQPGLLILKPVTRLGNVVYVFLVAQSPAVGVNGEQMQNALRYEKDLLAYGASLSLRDAASTETKEADIIGPLNSGSAASLRMSLESASLGETIKTISISGITATAQAADTLNFGSKAANGTEVIYRSFSDNAEFEQRKMLELFLQLHSNDASRFAYLLESSTVFGEAATTTADTASGNPVILTFPFNISLLRNAETEKATATPATGDPAAAVSPYLHMSLKDSGVEDTIPHFSEVTSISQESQWMAIVRELESRHVEMVAISASNILDGLFLAKSLHRDVPDARIVFFNNNDLLFAHYGDNAPYLGSISLSAYPFARLATAKASQRLYNFANGEAEAYFNAASYSFWNGKEIKDLELAGYSHTLTTKTREGPYQWATAVGHDGYYPLGILAPCATDDAHILPDITQAVRDESKTKVPCGDGRRVVSLDRVREDLNGDRKSFPALSWYVLCLIVTSLCVVHCIGVSSANFWSTKTRDLAIDYGDQPQRRALYLHIAAAMLVSMSLLVTIPLFTTLPLLRWDWFSAVFALVTLSAGSSAAALTWGKVCRHVLRPGTPGALQTSECLAAGFTWTDLKTREAEVKWYPRFNWLALLTVAVISTFWTYLCWPTGWMQDWLFAWPGSFTFWHGNSMLTGLFFGYRCLHPLSGVSPLPPILLLVLSWYLWAAFQTRRLRFGENSRPMLPGRLGAHETGFYVSDDALRDFGQPTSVCLYENLTCLFITQRLILRFTKKDSSGKLLTFFYGALFLVFVFLLPLRGLDHFLKGGRITGYEFLISSLFYPLLMISLTGLLRMAIVWNGLRRGVLDPLERSPLRYAFSRMANAAWTAMLKQGGLIEYWRDLARSSEAIQHLSHVPWAYQPRNDQEESGREKMARVAGVAPEEGSLSKHIKAVRRRIETGAGPKAVQSRSWWKHFLRAIRLLVYKGDGAKTPAWISEAGGQFLSGEDLPTEEFRSELNLMCAIECDFAKYAEGLLASVLIPYWREVRMSAVEAHGIEADDEEKSKPTCVDPEPIQLAEEFLAIRYVSLIRVVMINLRQLALFVTTAFVLATVAWSCYPFEPRRWINYAFTALLVLLGTGVVTMFAQMHRDPILSRITGTAANKLDGAFYVRLVTFGAVPILTWLAAQFPEIGGEVSKLLQGGLALAK